MREEIKWRLWQRWTAFVVRLPWVKAKWRRVFREEPCLFNARYHAGPTSPEDDPPRVEAVGYGTMAGFYNGNALWGHMNREQAKRIYGKG